MKSINNNQPRNEKIIVSVEATECINLEEAECFMCLNINRGPSYIIINTAGWQERSELKMQTLRSNGRELGIYSDHKKLQKS